MHPVWVRFYCFPLFLRPEKKMMKFPSNFSPISRPLNLQEFSYQWRGRFFFFFLLRTAANTGRAPIFFPVPTASLAKRKKQNLPKWHLYPNLVTQKISSRTWVSLQVKRTSWIVKICRPQSELQTVKSSNSKTTIGSVSPVKTVACILVLDEALSA